MSKVNFRHISTHKGPEESLGFLLWRVSITWRRLLEATLKSHDLTHPQFVILALLGWLTQHENHVTQSTIAQMAGLDPNTTSQILRGLEKKKFIKRITSTSDERAKLPSLTARGTVVLKKALPAVEKADHTFFSTLTKEDSKKMLTLFTQLIT